MAIQPRSVPPPTPRKWWVAKQPNVGKRSSLLVEYLEALATRRDHDEASAIRAFLIAWRRASVAACNAQNGHCIHGNKLPQATLMVRRNPKQLNQAIVFAMVRGAGPVKNVPVLVTPWSDHFTQFMRECGELPMHEFDRVKPSDAWGQPIRQPKPVVLEKANVHLVRMP